MTRVFVCGKVQVLVVAQVHPVGWPAARSPVPVAVSHGFAWVGFETAARVFGPFRFRSRGRIPYKPYRPLGFMAVSGAARSR